MKIPITIESVHQQEAFDWYVIAMKDYGTSVRTLDIMKKLYLKKVLLYKRKSHLNKVELYYLMDHYITQLNNLITT